MPAKFGRRAWRAPFWISACLLACVTWTTLCLAGSATYTYDELGRLRNVTYADGTSTTYTLDAAGNRVALVTGIGTPVNFVATAVSSTQINLSWSGQSLAAGYDIYTALDANGRVTGIPFSTTATSYAVPSLSPNTIYSYYLEAYDSAGNHSTYVQATARTLAQPPTAATVSAVAASETTINLSWSGAADAGGPGIGHYDVYRDGSKIATVNSTSGSGSGSYSDTGLSGYTTHSYYVITYDTSTPPLASPASSTVSTRTLDTHAPSTPGSPTATAASTTQLNLSWTASTDTGGSGLAGYVIYTALDANGRPTGIPYSTTATSLVVTGLAPYTSYNYYIEAYDNAGNYSAYYQFIGRTLAQAPTAPTQVSAAAASTSAINVSWSGAADAGGPGIGGYRVFRDGSQITTTTSTSYSDTGLSSYTSHTYYVVTYDSSTPPLASAASATASARTFDTSPGSPANVTATAVSTTQINVSWTAPSYPGSSGLAGYVIYYALDANGRPTGAATSTTATSLVMTGLTPNTYYSVYIEAYDNAGNYSAYVQASATTLPAIYTDSMAYTVGAVENNSMSYSYGYEQGFIGSLTPNTTTNGKTVNDFYTNVELLFDGVNWSSTADTYLVVSGFSSYPGAGWLHSISLSGGATLTGSGATNFSCNGTTCTWHWAQADGAGQGQSPVTIVHE